MYNQDELIEAILRDEREAQARWDAQNEGAHSFSTEHLVQPHGDCRQAALKAVVQEFRLSSKHTRPSRLSVNAS